MVHVDAQLIRRAASAFVQLDVRAGRSLSLILPANGWCWVGVPELPSLREEDLLALPEDRPEQFMDDFELQQAAHVAAHSQDAEVRQSIACVANLIALLNVYHRPINGDILAALYGVCMANNVSAENLLDPAVAQLVMRQ